MIVGLLIGCEEVVEIEAPAEEPRLIIDALIRVDETEPFVDIAVKVELSSSFFGTTPVTNLNQITIINFDLPTGTNGTENILFLIENEPGSGIYESAPRPIFSGRAGSGSSSIMKVNCTLHKPATFQ